MSEAVDGQEAASATSNNSAARRIPQPWHAGSTRALAGVLNPCTHAAQQSGPSEAFRQEITPCFGWSFHRRHSTRTGTPVSRAIPASASMSSGALDISRLTFAPPAVFARRQPPVPLWPHPCGTATTPATMSLVTMTGSSISPYGEAIRTLSPEHGKRRGDSVQHALEVDGDHRRPTLDVEV